MKVFLSIYILFGLFLFGCSSTIEISSEKDKIDGGIPIYAPKQEFIVTEKAIDAKGKYTENETIVVSLVTRPDYNNCYYVKNDPSWFSDSNFSITLDKGGRITALSAGVEDKSVETIQALASFVVTGFLAAAEKDTQELEKELKIQQDLEKNLIKELQNLTETQDNQHSISKKVKDISNSLSLVRSRINEIKGILKEKPKPKGITESGVKKLHTIKMVSDISEVKEEAKVLPGKEIGIYIVPVN